MDELDLSGKKYISAKRAASLTGYAKDYVGQLARAGKIAATRFGRAWYVEEASILAHAKADTQDSPVNEAPMEGKTAPIQAKKAQTISLPQHFYKPYSFPKTWSNVKYLSDDSELIPSVSKYANDASEITIKNIASSEKVDTVSEKNVAIKISPEVREPVRFDAPFRIIPGVNFDIPQPVVKAAIKTPMKANRTPIKRAESASWAPLAMAGAAAALIASYSVLGLAFQSGSIDLGTSGQYTSSALSAVGEVLGQIWSSAYVQAGISSIISFAHVIAGSFWAYVQAGFDFIKSLI